MANAINFSRPGGMCRDRRGPNAVSVLQLRLRNIIKTFRVPSARTTTAAGVGGREFIFHLRFVSAHRSTRKLLFYTPENCLSIHACIVCVFRSPDAAII